jgi:uncharacterized membrane protein YhaH (DUF805 family)
VRGCSSIIEPVVKPLFVMPVIRISLFVLIAAIVCAIAPTPAAAYIGPGAGAGFIGSLLTTISVIVVSLLAILIWPIRLLIKRWRKRKTNTVAATAKNAEE